MFSRKMCLYMIKTRDVCTIVLSSHLIQILHWAAGLFSFVVLFGFQEKNTDLELDKTAVKNRSYIYFFSTPF